jgi:hypothetical protein
VIISHACLFAQVSVALFANDTRPLPGRRLTTEERILVAQIDEVFVKIQRCLKSVVSWES